MPDAWPQRPVLSGPRVREDHVTRRPLVVPKSVLPLDRFSSLADASAYFAFFTPAVLYLHGRFTDYLWQDAAELYGRTLPLGFYRFAEPIWSDLGDGPDDDWNYALWAVPQEDWTFVRDFLLMTALFDSTTGWFVQYAFTEPAIRDVWADRNNRPPGTVVVTAFGCDASDGRHVIVPAQDPLRTRPAYRRLQPVRRPVVVPHPSVADGDVA